MIVGYKIVKLYQIKSSCLILSYLLRCLSSPVVVVVVISLYGTLQFTQDFANFKLTPSPIVLNSLLGYCFNYKRLVDYHELVLYVYLPYLDRMFQLIPNLVTIYSSVLVQHV